MKIQPALAVTGLLLPSLASLGLARDRSPLRLPCDQVARMGLKRYFARYTAAAHDDSTAGSIRACDSYARCRRSVSDGQARALSPARRAQVAQVRRSLDALGDACYDYTIISAGGGTIWSQLAAGDRASREDFLAALIADLRRTGVPSPAARRQADVALGKARRSLAVLRAPQVVGDPPPDPSSLGEYRGRTYPAARAAFARLQALVAALPDAPARRVAREAEEELAEPSLNLKDN